MAVKLRLWILRSGRVRINRWFESNKKHHKMSDKWVKNADIRWFYPVKAYKSPKKGCLWREFWQ